MDSLQTVKDFSGESDHSIGMKTLFLKTTERLEESISTAARLIAAGEIVAFPTETVYGLGADATDPEAIAKVFKAKGRPSDNPMIVHVADQAGLARCAEVDSRVNVLIERFMPGPLTLVLPSKEIIPAVARAGLPTLALRIPDHPVALALISATGPLVAPSANLSGRPSPTTARHVMDDLDGTIAAVLDGGPCRVGIESTVLDLSGEEPVVLRPGIITEEEIISVLGVGKMGDKKPREEKEEHPRSPGMKYRHYAPRIPVRLISGDDLPIADKTKRLILTVASHRSDFPQEGVELVTEASLYEQFRRAEVNGLEEILIYARPEELGEGLFNRVEKAIAGQ